jgi:hypothetical protein
MAKSKNGTRVFKIIFRILGFMFLIAGAVLTFLAYDFMNNALPVTGRVVSVEVISSDDGVSYKPTIRFVDWEGRKQRGQTFISSSKYNFDIGEDVDILYDIRDPKLLRMDTWFATWGFGLIFLGASVIPFIIAGIVGRAGGRKVKAKPKRKPRRARAVTQVEDDQTEEDMIEIPARTKGLISRESRSDHERETNYTPTVRRNR